MSQIQERAYRYLIEAMMNNVLNTTEAKAVVIRRLIAEDVKPFIAESAVRYAFKDLKLEDIPTRINWKPIDATQMEVGKWYLICGIKWDYPDVGRLLESGFIESGNGMDDYGGGSFLYHPGDVTHYAEFNKPEGVE